MPALVGLIILLLALWAIKSFAKANPKVVATLLKLVGGIVALAVAAFLGVRGAIWIAIPLGVFALGLLGWLPWSSSGFVAYLDRRSPRWREDLQGDATAGRGSGTRSGKMTEEEAYQILGLERGASAEDIGRAHRSLMKKLHPDQGGSTYLAARVNEAKDVLLQRHR